MSVLPCALVGQGKRGRRDRHRRAALRYEAEIEHLIEVNDGEVARAKVVQQTAIARGLTLN
jgi:hypothetical protein